MYSLKFSSVFRRFLAYLVDITIICILTLILTSIIKVFFLLFGGVRGAYWFELYWWFMNGIVAFILSIFYFSLFLCTSLSSTLGQLLFRIKVVDQFENPISFGRAIGRYFASYLSVLTLFLGIIMAFYNPNRQMLHDKICKTYVIER